MARQPGILARAVEKAVEKQDAAETSVAYKENGAIRPKVRNLICQLGSLGVSTKVISEVISDVTSVFGLGITDEISECSVGRIILEGLVIAKMQIGFKLSLTKGKRQTFGDSVDTYEERQTLLFRAMGQLFGISNTKQTY